MTRPAGSRIVASLRQLRALDRRQFGGLLVATTIATYVLIALGTAISTTGSGSTCTTWPSCSTDWTVGPVTSDGLLFWGHRVAALGTGVLLAATGIAARGRELDRRVAGTIWLAVALYPVQVALGAALVVGGPALASAFHLLLAMVIFAGLLVALVVTLERQSLEDGITDDVPPLADGITDDVSPLTNGVDDGAGVEADSARTTAADESAIAAEESSPARNEGATGAGSRLARARRIAGAYLALTKPRLMWLLCLVALAGMGLATLTGEGLEVGVVVATLAGGVLAIGASGTFNHVLERDRDRRMDRTSDRPLVHDLVPIHGAVAFGSALAVSSTAIMLVWVNGLAAGFTLAAIAYYVVLYTALLKPNTRWNTVLGGGAGALPALIGWAAVTGSVGLPALVLAAVIFLWTPAHFYSLAIAYREDYAKGGFPMLPVVEGVLTARRHVVLYLGATLLAASLLGWLAGLGWIYALASVALGAVFLRSVVRQYRTATDDAALRSFYASNYYLGAILVAIVLETLLVGA